MGSPNDIAFGEDKATGIGPLRYKPHVGSIVAIEFGGECFSTQLSAKVKIFDKCILEYPPHYKNNVRTTLVWRNDEGDGEC
jgi:hypothetical protein